MPWKKVKNHPKCPKSKPIGVVKTADGELEGCHSSQASANRQLAALNASESKRNKSPNFGETGNGPFSVSGPVISLPLEGEAEAKMSKGKSKRRRPRRSKRKTPPAPRIAMEAEEAYKLIDKIRGNDDGNVQEPVESPTDEVISDGYDPADTPVPTLAMKEQAELPDDGKENEDLDDSDQKMHDMAVPVVEWQPFGGSESWDELDEYLEAEEFEESTRQASFEFGRMVNNVFKNLETSLAEKGQRVATLAEGLAERAEDIREKDIDVDDKTETDVSWTGTINKIIMGLKKKPDPEDVEVDIVKPHGRTGFVTFKDLEQRDRWFGWVTNNFRDRDIDAAPELGGEILTDEAHKDFVAWVEKDPEKRMPQLWPWHTKEGAHEHRADWIGYVNGFLLMSGPLEPDEAKAIERVAEEWELGMSHGFYALSRDQEKGLVKQYRSFEVSYLPLDFTANMWTDFMTVGDKGR